MQGKITAAIKFLDQESSTALVTPSREVLEELAQIREECLLNGPLDQIPPNIFDLTNEQMIYGAGMDAELYRRILFSKNFASKGKLLSEEIAVMTRNLLKSCYHPSPLEA